jgi:hypothetical protein
VDDNRTSTAGGKLVALGLTLLGLLRLALLFGHVLHFGPKIDITIADAIQREFQCATIQLDYQAPINFKMETWSRPS